MSVAITASNCVRHALVKLGGLDSAVLVDSQQTILDLWNQASTEVLKKVSDDPLACEFAASHLLEFNLDAFSKDCQGMKRCPCSNRVFHSETGFSALIAHMDPAWNGASNVTEEQRSIAFTKAVHFVEAELIARLKHYANEVYLGMATVKRAITETYDPLTKCIFLDRFVPWRDHIYDLEEAAGVSVHWVIFEDDRSLQWRCTSVSDKTNRFTNRALLSEDLRGLQGQEIAAKINYSGEGEVTQFFVHHSGFTGGAPTKEAMISVLKH